MTPPVYSVSHPFYFSRDPRRIGVRAHDDNLYVVKYARGGGIERVLMTVEGGGSRLSPAEVDGLRRDLRKTVRVAGEVHYFGQELPRVEGVSLAQKINASRKPR